MALQVGGVSDETVKYCREFWGTSTQKWLLCQGPEGIYSKITHPTSRQRGRYKITKPQLSETDFKEKEKLVSGSQMDAWHQNRLADWLSAVN
jgi:hypothetical protein